MRLQSSLGRVYQDDSQDSTHNYLTVAKVLRVHHKSGTADVVVVNTKDTIVSSPENEGRYSARIVNNLAGYDEKRGKAWGEVTPILVGSLVLLAFLDNMKKRPIIVGQFHDPASSNNVLSRDYPLNPNDGGYDRREALKAITVYPHQGYKKMDGDGNMEFTHPSKSFFAAYNTHTDVQDSLTDFHGGFDHDHVSETDPQTGEPYETDFEEAKTPLRWLYSHRSSFEDNETTWTKFFMNDRGGFRWTRDTNDMKLTYVEIDENGRYVLRRQIDNNMHGESEDFGEIILDTDGSVFIQRKIDGENTTIGIDNQGHILAGVKGMESFIQLGDNIHLESQGKIFSDSLSKFINENHIVVSDEEPENPTTGLIWIDTSA